MITIGVQSAIRFSCYCFTKRPFLSSFKTETGLRERHISYKIQTFIRILLIIVKMYPSPPTIVPSMLHVLLQFHLITESNVSTFEVPTTLMPFQKFTSSFWRKRSKIFSTTLVVFSRACPHWIVFSGKLIRFNQSIQTRNGAFSKWRISKTLHSRLNRFRKSTFLSVFSSF